MLTYTACTHSQTTKEVITFKTVRKEKAEEDRCRNMPSVKMIPSVWATVAAHNCMSMLMFAHLGNTQVRISCVYEFNALYGVSMRKINGVSMENINNVAFSMFYWAYKINH